MCIVCSFINQVMHYNNLLLIILVLFCFTLVGLSTSTSQRPQRNIAGTSTVIDIWTIKDILADNEVQRTMCHTYVMSSVYKLLNLNCALYGQSTPKYQRVPKNIKILKKSLFEGGNSAVNTGTFEHLRICYKNNLDHKSPNVLVNHYPLSKIGDLP